MRKRGGRQWDYNPTCSIDYNKHRAQCNEKFPNILIVQVNNCIFQEKDKISRTLPFVSEVERLRVNFWEKRGRGSSQDDRMFRQPEQPTGTVSYNILYILMTFDLDCLEIWEKMNSNCVNKILIWKEMRNQMHRISVLIKEIFSCWIWNNFHSWDKNNNKLYDCRANSHLALYVGLTCYNKSVPLPGFSPSAHHSFVT